MVIETLELSHYRNYEYVKIDLSPGVNILYGDNAQGKTNILEAIHVCSTSKSHRGSKDRDMVQFEQDEAHIKMIVKKEQVPYRIDMHLKKHKNKGIAVDGIPIKKIGELFGIVNVVFFSPEDLGIIKSGPAERRRFLDLELCQLEKLYLTNLSQYNRIVNQRNRLLKDMDFHPELADTLFAWDIQLVKTGEAVIKARQSLIEELNDVVKYIHSGLTGGKENLEIVYDMSCRPGMFQQELAESFERDKHMKMTNKGPHRDDLNFVVNGIDLKRFGSQGQQRTAALSLKMAEIALVKKKIHDMPVLLLDDVLSELDSNRQNELLGSLNEVQTIVTCTGLDDFIESRCKVDKVYHVVQGTITG